MVVSSPPPSPLSTDTLAQTSIPQPTGLWSVCGPSKTSSLCPHPQVVGLYRLCGSAAVKKELRDAFERDSAAVCLSEDLYPDINVITGQHGPHSLPTHFLSTLTSKLVWWPCWDLAPHVSPCFHSPASALLFFYTLPASGTPLASEARGALTRGDPVSAGILKDYLRELPTPLITQPLYQVVLEAMAQGPPSRVHPNPEGTRSLLNCLPEVERVSWPWQYQWDLQDME